MNLVLLVLYHISIYLIGRQILQRLKVELPMPLFIVGSFLFGILVGVPFTYGLACLFTKTGEPIFWGVLVATIITTGVTYLVSHVRNKKEQRANKISPVFDLSSLILIGFSLVFSTWLMFKTFHGGAGDQLFVGSNNVFDFGHSLGLIRSMSWGANIPLMSPFFAGLPYFYHFIFLFWTAIWEYLGVPIVLAMNAPSIFSFSALLIIVYYFTQLVFHQDRLAGWIAVILTITHSTLTFWILLMKKGMSVQFIRDLWNNPTYPFAGPFDGSTISIYMTLNNYVNQRHLAFSIAAGLFIILLYIQSRKQSLASVALIGLFTGLLFLWNVPVCLLVGCILAIFLFISKNWRMVVVFTSMFLLGLVVLLFQYVSNIPLIIQFFSAQIVKGSIEARILTPSWTPISYLWQNLGILPVMVVAGLFVIKKRTQTVAAVFIGLFIILCLLSLVGNRGFDQKFLSFLIIPINMIAAIAVIRLWKQKSLFAKIVCITILFILTVSGFVDLAAVKNEFAFPLVGNDTIPVITWIHSSTPRNAIFVSYRDMIDPVVFSGRTNYFGFFGNIGQTDRSSIVRTIYMGNTSVAKKLAISYILIPKWQKNDFPYIVDEQKLGTSYHTVYEDDRFLVVKTSQ